MKLKNISCTQFAGVRDINVNFSDGINVIYGKNESGKSTLVNLISRTLFQNAKIDGRSDREFRELYFPGAIRGKATVSDFVDGKISFETENGTYTLSKVWGADSHCMLSTPEGVIRDQKSIDAALRDALTYGEGVYADMLLSSQRGTDLSLQTILDSAKKTDAKQELTGAVSKAFAESDGISAEQIEQAIQAKIDEIAGKHWDFDRQQPMRKTGSGRWAAGLGEILKAYYAYEDAKNELEKISQLELDADKAAGEYTQASSAAETAEAAYTKFSGVSERLKLQNEHRKNIARLESDLQKAGKILNELPKLESGLKSARALAKEKKDREVLDKYTRAEEIYGELADLDAAANSSPSPEEEEIAKVRAAQRGLARLEGELCKMNITAAVNMLNGHKIEAISLRTGEPVDISSGTAAITEAVKITVAGVMEMVLSPTDLDTADVTRKIENQKNGIAAIFAKYGVQTLEELENLAKELTAAKSKAEDAKTKLALILNGEDFEQVKIAASETTGDIRTAGEIEREISVLCNGDTARYITAKETVLAGYTEEYGTANDLKAKAYDLENELKREREFLAEDEDMPEEYAAIADPERYSAELQAELKRCRALRDEKFEAKSSAVSRLDAARETADSDPAAKVNSAKAALDGQKALLGHWLHIAEVFKAQKDKLSANPMHDIAERFAEYLKIISGGRVDSEFPEADRLNMNIYSNSRLLSYAKLSEGTKETVSLAFRLAVLDHLFPDGGVIVLDDPLTDMDDDREALACKLIEACAERHQVIFLTCKKDFLESIDGNKIQFGN